MVSSVYAESESPADGRGADQNVIQVTKVTASPADGRVAQSMWLLPPVRLLQSL